MLGYIVGEAVLFCLQTLDLVLEILNIHFLLSKELFQLVLYEEQKYYIMHKSPHPTQGFMGGEGEGMSPLA